MDPVAFAFIFLELCSLARAASIHEYSTDLAEIIEELTSIIPVHDGTPWTEARQWCVFMALRAAQSHDLPNKNIAVKLRTLPH